jgi:hypothetical protein
MSLLRKSEKAAPLMVAPSVFYRLLAAIELPADRADAPDRPIAT